MGAISAEARGRDWGLFLIGYCSGLRTNPFGRDVRTQGSVSSESSRLDRDASTEEVVYESWAQFGFLHGQLLSSRRATIVSRHTRRGHAKGNPTTRVWDEGAC